MDRFSIPSSSKPSTGDADGLEAYLIESLATTLDVARGVVGVDQPLADMGVDSIVGVQWVRALNHRYGINLPVTVSYDHPTIREIAAVVEKAIDETRRTGGAVDAIAAARTDGPTGWSGHDRGPSPIAVVGLSAQFPMARDPREFWANIAQGRDCVSEIPRDRWGLDGFYQPRTAAPGRSYSKWMGALDGVDRFDAAFFMLSPAEAERIDPQQRLFLEHCWRCLEDAGIDPGSVSGSRCGVFAGCGPVDYGAAADRTTAHELTGMSPAMVSARVAYFLDLKGPCLSIDTASSSSLVAIAQACDSLVLGHSDLALAGGVSVLSGPSLHVSASDAGMLSPRGRCFTFDARADGFVPAEGVGIVLLERLEDALAGGHHIYAVIRGWAVNQDGKTNGITAPSAASQAQLQIDVYRRFGIDPASITLVEAHGTGTPLGDPIEVDALKRSFRAFTNKSRYCALGSVKSNIGHPLAAAGVAGLIKVTLALQHRMLPPAAQFVQLNEHIDLDDSPFVIDTTLRAWDTRDGSARRAAVSAFGFGGTNAHVVLEEYAAPPVSSTQPPSLEDAAMVVVLLSAKTREQLAAQVRQLRCALQGGGFADADLPDIAYTLQVGRQAMAVRMAVLTTTLSDLIEKLQGIEEGKAVADCHRGLIAQRPMPNATFNGEIAAQDAETIGRADAIRLVEQWVRGAAVDWHRLHSRGTRRRISLPTYPFGGDRHWIARKTPPAELPPPLTFEEEWHGEALSSEGQLALTTVLCLISDPRHAQTAVQAFRRSSSGVRVILCSRGKTFRRIDGDLYEVNSTDPASWRTVLESIMSEGVALDAAVYLDAVGSPHHLRDYRTPVALLQATAATRLRCARIVLAGTYSTPVERCYIDSWIGLGRSLRRAMPATDIAVVAGAATERAASETVFGEHIDRLCAEVGAAVLTDVTYENGARLVTRMVATTRQEPRAMFRCGGTYLITGGAGGLGWHIAMHLADRYDANVILTGRSELGLEKQKQLSALNVSRARAWYAAADVCDGGRMWDVINTAHARFGPIHGVIHAAGTLDGESLLTKDLDRFECVLAAKVQGTLVLDDVLGADPLDFVCYCSSIAAVLGDFGDGDYAVASRFQVAYARYAAGRVARNPATKVVAIQWPLWKDGGMRPHDAELYLEGSGQRALGTDEGLALLQRLVGEPCAAPFVIAVDPERVHGWLRPAAGREIEPRSPAATELIDDAERSAALQWFKELLTRTLKLPPDRVDSDGTWDQYGIDSVLVLKLTRTLEHDFGALSKTLFFEHQSLEALVDYFLRSHRDSLLALTSGRQPAADRLSARIEAPPATPLVRPRTPARGSDLASPGLDIAIVGMAGRYPCARDLREYWSNLEAGRDCVSEVPPERWSLREFYEPDMETAIARGRSYCKWGGFIDSFADFDPLFFNIAPREALTMDPQERLYLELCWCALEDAGYTRELLARRHEGRVGVFAGVTKTGFDLYGPELWRQGKALMPRTCFGSVANRVSYALNLHGPSIPIDTMCSSSLTAIHEACQHLARDECELALAGGVNLYVHPSSFVHLCQRRLLSPTGRCRSFGEGGDGMVPGEGGGVVLLKSLSRAIEDEDHVYAIIRSSGINHGGKTNGYTVPNPVAHRELIRRALMDAGIGARSISYIEAHGTGTELGDPIEVTGLTQAFEGDTAEKQFCAIGSVKSNIGHLEAAAGVAGLQKIILQMTHRQLVPTLHAERPNPNIDFASTPFALQRDLGEWKRPCVKVDGVAGEYSRTAGLSSFGAGGSNAHVIVQEYIPQASAVASPHLAQLTLIVVLSAKNESRLRARMTQLLKMLTDRALSTADLPNVAYTLQVGREPMEHRCALVAATIDELRDKLERGLAGDRNVDGLYRGEAPPSDGILPHLQADDDVAALVGRWAATGKHEKLATLWVHGLDIDWSGLYGAERPRRISLPAYPFAGERYWPVTAGAREGAGCTEPPLTRPGSWLHPLLQTNTSDLNGIRFTSTFTGDEFFLADHVVQGMRVLPAVAYLEMARAAVARAAGDGVGTAITLRDIVWIEPLAVQTTPVTVHIDVMPAADETIEYEIYSDGSSREMLHARGTAAVHRDGPSAPIDVAAMLRQCAEPARSGAECYAAYAAKGLAYGPAFCGLARVHTGRDAEGRPVALGRLELPAVVSRTAGAYGLHPSVMDSALHALAGLWGSGEAADSPRVPFALDHLETRAIAATPVWAAVRLAHDTTERVPKFDVDLCDEQGVVAARLRGLTLRAVTLEDAVSQTLLMTSIRHPSPAPLAAGAASIARDERRVIVCGGDSTLARVAESEGEHWYLLSTAAVHAAERFEYYAATVMRHLQEVLRSHSARDVVVQCVVAPSDGGLLRGLAGLLKTAQLENPRLTSQLIEIDLQEPFSAIKQKVDENVGAVAGLIQYDRDTRYVESLEELNEFDSPSAPPFKPGGVYLISGGAGGIGLRIAADLAKRIPDVALVLAGRSSFGESQRAALAELEQSGARVQYRTTDVTDRAAVHNLVCAVTADHGRIDGVFHLAGVLADNLLLKKTQTELAAVFGPKVHGLVNLDEATQDLALDFFVAFSSLSAAVGSVGQADYSAANAFMDRYMCYRSDLVQAGRRTGRSLSIGWPLWSDGGMSADVETRRRMAKRGLLALPVAAGVAALNRAMATGHSHVVVGFGHAPTLRAALLGDSNHVEIRSVATTSSPDAAISDADLTTQVVRFVAKRLATVLAMPVERLEPGVPLEEYGMDSVLALRLIGELEETFGALSKTLFFEYPTLDAVAGYFVAAHSDTLRRAGGGRDARGAAPAIDEPSAAASFAARPRRTRRHMRPRSTLAPATLRALDVAIIGLAGRYPGARDLRQFWENLKAGRDCITEIPSDRWDYRQYFDAEKGKAGKTYSKWGGFIDGVDEFDPLLFGISPRDAQAMDPQQRLFLECAWETLEDAGYCREWLTRRRARVADADVGVFVGVMYDEYPFFGIEAQALGQPVALLSNPASIANRVSYVLNLHGPSLAVNTMCSSSLTAIHLACQSLADGSAMAIAGGVNVSIHPNKYLGLAQGQFMSTTGRCESFGRGGDGYVPAEGVGAVLLKPLARAVADGDHIYGVIKGSAINHGGRTTGYTVPNPAAQGEVIARALQSAEVPARAISYIEAHGTGTSLGDPIEIAGLSKVFQSSTSDRQFCAIGSVKSNIGHAESAAGIAGLTKVLLQMRHRQLVPSLHTASLNPHIDFASTPFVVQREATPWARPQCVVDGVRCEYPRLAAVSSFGAGGANAHLVVEEYDAPQRADATDVSRSQSVVLSAKSENQLQEQARNLLAAMSGDTVTDADLASVAYTLQVGREAMEHRLAVNAGSVAELRGKLARVVAGEDEIDGVYHGDARRHKEALGLLGSDEDAAALLETWTSKGKHGQVLDLWVKGLSVDWTHFHTEPPPGRISLPTYPFARERYWVERPSLSEQCLEMASAREDSASSARREVRFVTKGWTPCAIGTRGRTVQRAVIVASDETSALAKELQHSIPGSDILNVDSTAPGASVQWPVYDCWIDVVGCGAAKDESTAWIHMLQQWIEQGPLDGGIAMCVTRQLEARANSRINLAGASRAGLYRMLQAEYRRLRSRHMDTDLVAAEDVTAQIVSELAAAGDETEVCYLGSERYRAELEETHVVAAAATITRRPSLRADDVLWITGGTRGIGYQCARWFVERHGVKRLLLTGRDTFPPREEWDRLEGGSDALREKIRAVRALEAAGADVRISSVPLTDLHALRAEIDDVTRTLGPIAGVIHCAGALDTETPAFVGSAPESIERVMAPKVSGLDNLIACVESRALLFVGLFSSVAAGIPALAVGQAVYANANSHMDYVAEAFADRLPIVSIQWPSWQETGMGEATTAAYKRTGLLTLTNDEGLELLDRVLSDRLGAVVMPAVVDPDRWNPAGLLRSGGEPATVSAAPPPTGDIVPDRFASATEMWLRSLVASELKLTASRLDVDTPLLDYGADSVMLMQLLRRVGAAIDATLDPSILFERGTIAAFARWLTAHHSDALAAALPSALQAPLSGDADRPLRRHPDIAVVGMACRFPGAHNLDEYWALLSGGRSAISAISKDRHAALSDHYAGLLDDVTHFDPAYFLIPDADARAMDPQALLILEESLHACYHAGYLPDELKGSRIGVYVGGRSQHRPDAVALERAQNPIVAVGQNYLAANVSRFFDLRGPSLVVDTACSSALVAMDIAIQALDRGDIDAALVGGVNVLKGEALNVFHQRGILSTESEFHLFDRRARGAVLGEGAAMVVVKTLDRALRDSDTIYAVVKSLAINNDGRTAGPAAPNVQAEKDVMRAALERGRIRAEDVAYVEVSGSGSEVTDLLELKAIESVYRAVAKGRCELGSVKPNIGHPLAAEAIASLTKIVLMLHHRTLVPFLSAQQPMTHYDLEASPFRLSRAMAPWNAAPRIAAINSFADGGTNAHALVEGWDAGSRRARRTPIRPPLLQRIDLSAREDNGGKRLPVEPLPSESAARVGFWARIRTPCEHGS